MELRVGQRSRRVLVLLVALISSVFAFASAAGEARAEQLPQAPQQPVKVTGAEAAGPVAERPPAKVSPNEPVPVETTPAVVAPFETAPARKPPVETPAVETTPVGTLPTDTPAGESATPQAPEPSTLPSAGSAVRPGSGTQLDLVGGQPVRYGPETTLYPAPASEHAAEPSDDARPATGPGLRDSGALLPAGQTPEPDTVPEAGLAPDSGSDAGLAPPALAPTPEPLASGLILEPAAFEGGPLSPVAEEPPAPVEKELYFLSSLADAADGAVETIESVDAGTLGTIAGWPLRPAAVDGVDVALVIPFSGIEVVYAPESELAEDSGVSSAGPSGPVEIPLRDAPQPVSPSLPPAGGNSFSLLGSSVLGSGGLALLLFCILATGPIVLRRDSKLMLTLRELPKPNSALRLPLERPG